MEKLQFYDKNDDINIMSLSELKNMLYNDKNISNESKDIIKNIIKDKIKNSLLENETSSSEESISEEKYNNAEFDYDIDNTSEESNDDYKNEIKKLYDRSDRKGENERFTQTSQKLFDRMFSHAQIINNSYNGVNTQKISKPFATDNPGRIKLGERKNIGRK